MNIRLAELFRGTVFPNWPANDEIEAMVRELKTTGN
jgi:hypothetical protein